MLSAAQNLEGSSARQESGHPMAQVTSNEPDGWLKTKLQQFYPHPRPETIEQLTQAVKEQHAPAQEPLFENPFQIADLLIFDEEMLRDLLANGIGDLTTDDLARGLRDAPDRLIERSSRALPRQERARFQAALRQPVHPLEDNAARRRLLDALFWELTYWKTPDLYEELTEGERIHPGIFRHLAPDLRGKAVLDAGAGSGRATFACLRQGAQHVYAVEPSPGLLRLLEGKLAHHPARRQIIPLPGRFDALPLADRSVDTTIACSAFTAQPEQGGAPGLAELKRVTRPGGKIVLIWPRPEDYAWLAGQGFQYVALPLPTEPQVRFRSLGSALRAARRFYGRNPAVQHALLRSHRPEVPSSLLTANPPHDYCWLRVTDQ
jgi:SAM-dependent methyltransferase